MKAPYKHFDLPTHHLSGYDYVPPKQHDSSEAERLHELPHGTLLLEKQHHGLLVATRMIEQLEDEPDLAYAGAIVAASAFNASWYSYGREAQMSRMRRRLELMSLVDPETLTLYDPLTSKERITRSLASAADLAGDLVYLHVHEKPTTRAEFSLGRTLGTVATGLAAITMPSADPSLSPRLASEQQRWHSSVALERSRGIVPDGSTHPSTAQFAEPYSDISVMIHRYGPKNVKSALENAQGELHETAA